MRTNERLKRETLSLLQEERLRRAPAWWGEHALGMRARWVWHGIAPCTADWFMCTRVAVDLRQRVLNLCASCYRVRTLGGWRRARWIRGQSRRENPAPQRQLLLDQKQWSSRWVGHARAHGVLTEPGRLASWEMRPAVLRLWWVHAI